MTTTPESKAVSSIFIGRWTPKVLFSLDERPYRHGQLRRRVGSVSQRMLTRTLRETIIAPLGGMCRWAKRYRRNVSAEVRLRETETG
jgi:HxlR-like helix-turn-helix